MIRFNTCFIKTRSSPANMVTLDKCFAHLYIHLNLISMFLNLINMRCSLLMPLLFLTSVCLFLAPYSSLRYYGDYSSRYKLTQFIWKSDKWVFILGTATLVIHLTLTVLVATIEAQWEGTRDVGSARYEPALLPPCPTIRVLSYSN